MTILNKSKLDPQISCLKQAEWIPSDSDSWLASSAGLYQDSCKILHTPPQIGTFGLLN